MPVNLLSVGGGTTTLTAASSASNFTITLPATTGTMALTSDISTAAILSAIASASLGAVGTYSWLWTTTTGAVAAGATIAGSNLRYAGFQSGASGTSNNSDNSLSGNGGTPSGTWRVMGRGAQANYSIFLALRIS